MAFRVQLKHFMRAAEEIGRSGDNDTLPYDIESAFVKDNATALAKMSLQYFRHIEELEDVKKAQAALDSLPIFSERLLAPAGAYGFRISTKISMFWNVYLNGIAIAFLECFERYRSDRVFSYRYEKEGAPFFSRSSTWKFYKEQTISRLDPENSDCVVVLTDISSFYERVYHHRLQNTLQDIAGERSRAPLQVDRLLNKLSAGKSFGLPVGGQASRILAEAMLLPVDSALDDAGLDWMRYVDDYTIVCNSQREAYRALSVLSHTLADYGLSLNKIKTTTLKAKHYKEYAEAQVGLGEGEQAALHEIDLHYDPYSDEAVSQYQELKEAVEAVDFELLLGLEKEKSQPDNFVVTQVARALQFHSPKVAADLCATLIEPQNLESFRASFPKIMKGIYAVRSRDEFKEIFGALDTSIDRIISDAPHLLLPETNMLHFLRLIRAKKTYSRGQFVRKTFDEAKSQMVRRYCVDCWKRWHDSAAFMRMVAEWPSQPPEVQKMIWWAANDFGDQGGHAKGSMKATANQSWALGVEDVTDISYSKLLLDWSVENAA